MFNVVRLLSSHLSKSLDLDTAELISITGSYQFDALHRRDDSDDAECFELFELWSEKYEKTYPSEEDKLYRFQLFKSRVHFKPPNKRFLHLLTKYHPNIVSPLPDRSSIQSSHPDPSIPGRVRLIESLLSCNANSNEMKEASNEVGFA
ncbi:hypothetical protein TSUD_303680 [Trifolium subterraneum]|uniref:Cathepsin propeptide inhibitor domain-containing protein n=1 Tax=Trifolium subterraneum TaxID=3900 RepID=A0A2Z6MTW8_TRISU|nr:hypothetical protein TSUD_303680 [Trifolium subterraneum]